MLTLLSYLHLKSTLYFVLNTVGETVYKVHVNHLVHDHCKFHTLLPSYQKAENLPITKHNTGGIIHLSSISILEHKSAALKQILRL
jgi:hypothetical protein